MDPSKKEKGAVFVWGCNDNHELGLAEPTNKREPTPFEDFKNKKIKTVAAGGYQTIFLTMNGEMYLLGRIASKSPKKTKGNRVPLIKRTKVRNVSCGQRFATSITDKEITVFTDEEMPSVESEVIVSITPPRPDYFSKQRVISVSTGSTHCAAVVVNLDGDNLLYTWGNGKKGQLGIHSTEDRQEPTLVESLSGTKPRSVHCGSEYTLVVTERGGVYSFGSGDSGRLGIGVMDNVLYPVVIPVLNPLNIQQISAGPDHAAALTVEGALYTWGYGSNGRLGHGADTDLAVPTRVELLERKHIVRVSCGGHHTAVITDRGELYSFGWNFYGQLGIPDAPDDCMEPSLVNFPMPAGGRFIEISCGEQHTVAYVAVPK
eukprot:TRINITY_DN13185_c0_g1_i1.p1 TRINITY_DN13185_c0_g1~~TRINITY_DN13185_c0_g1_i1.p1  ORF type:complete len:381 (+),score=110.58 TRINITY_DN13185_c0_g1_i1:24-1145(+)